MQRETKGGKEMENIIIFFLIMLNLDYLCKFVWQVVYQIDRYLCLVPIFNREFGKDISILTIILRNALLLAKKM